MLQTTARTVTGRTGLAWAAVVGAVAYFVVTTAAERRCEGWATRISHFGSPAPCLSGGCRARAVHMVHQECMLACGRAPQLCQELWRVKGLQQICVEPLFLAEGGEREMTAGWQPGMATQLWLGAQDSGLRQVIGGDQAIGGVAAGGGVGLPTTWLLYG